jgi:hypothetical protein
VERRTDVAIRNCRMNRKLRWIPRSDLRKRDDFPKIRARVIGCKGQQSAQLDSIEQVRLMVFCLPDGPGTAAIKIDRSSTWQSSNR